MGEEETSTSERRVGLWPWLGAGLTFGILLGAGAVDPRAR